MDPFAARAFVAVLVVGMASMHADPARAAVQEESAQQSQQPAAPVVTGEQRRCGWLGSRGPQDTVLTDRDGDWLLAREGEHATSGNWRSAVAAEQQAGKTDTESGCGCLTVRVDLASHRVVSASAGQARPIASCRGDKLLDASAGAAHAGHSRKTYRMRTFSFSYPATWRASDDGDHCASLDAPGAPDTDPYSLRLCSIAGPLSEAAGVVFFEPDDTGRWMRMAGQDRPSPVAWMFGPGWSGMFAVQSCAIADEETGFHAGAGDCLQFAGSDGRQSVVADTVGRYGDFAAVREILRSIRFSNSAHEDR